MGSSVMTTRQEDNNMQGVSSQELVSSQEEVPSSEQISEENLFIIAKREEKLLGKTVQGTLVATTRSSGKTTYWVRWNKRKCDAVLVREDLIEKHFGDNAPLEGSQIMCTIIALGPDLSKLAYKSAWCMHPQCNEIAVLSNGYPTPPKRKSLQNKHLTTSESIVSKATPREFTPEPTLPRHYLQRSFTEPTLSDRVKRNKQSRPRFFNSKIPETSSPNWQPRERSRTTSLLSTNLYTSTRRDSLLRRCAGAPFTE